jgi:hypothetical protein
MKKVKNILIMSVAFVFSIIMLIPVGYAQNGKELPEKQEGKLFKNFKFGTGNLKNTDKTGLFDNSQINSRVDTNDDSVSVLQKELADATNNAGRWKTQALGLKKQANYYAKKLDESRKQNQTAANLDREVGYLNNIVLKGDIPQGSYENIAKSVKNITKYADKFYTDKAEKTEALKQVFNPLFMVAAVRNNKECALAINDNAKGYFSPEEYARCIKMRPSWGIGLESKEPIIPITDIFGRDASEIFAKLIINTFNLEVPVPCNRDKLDTVLSLLPLHVKEDALKFAYSVTNNVFESMSDSKNNHYRDKLLSLHVYIFLKLFGKIDDKFFHSTQEAIYFGKRPFLTKWADSLKEKIKEHKEDKK